VKSSSDDIDSENPDEDVISPVPKIGPPRGQKTQSSTKTNENPANVAGSSKIPSLKELSKLNLGKSLKPDGIAAKTSRDSTSKTRPVGGKVRI
jgi:hypothetical protein